MTALMARDIKSGQIVPIDIRGQVSDLLLLAQLQERLIECSEDPTAIEVYFQLGVNLEYVGVTQV